ncbi:glycolipid 2-alpha-mannosyltransferase-domain-containing protein [Radiomyces spectabilis]|uniref:glycolipid 2-alpha-mannosyltransferase-domain-containing protein n=1 Tax=Radiomyces spectabilis TaxID=64574 RepID=UPI00221ED4E9|nr:glycolipid 2-alpha-mannosyltransferase-domain-containing protein [Radiomyces spectabilis]KAI8374305.1 glycolipid 2-alpha-mannosyltransferase-domain-containing protein [Radiomyces spectabilis]
MEASLNDQDRPSLPHPLETDSRTTDLSDSGDYPRHLPWIRPAPEVEHEKVHNLGPYTQVDDSIPMQVWDHLPVRGAFYMVVRKENLVQARMTLRNLEDRFNRHKRYPIIVLGNQYYSDKFRKYLSKATESPIYFGKIDPLVWDYPGWIDISQAEESMQFMSIYRIPNGDSLAFRQTSRYHAGFFFHHPLFANVQYTWRIEPGSVYTCEMETDPFQYMYDHKKVLGFTQSQKEHQDTMLSLWLFTMEFMKKSSDLVLPRNETIMPWMVDESNHYNRCVLLSQFQIVDLSFLRSTAYQKYFAFLDRKGGFFYER